MRLLYLASTIQIPQSDEGGQGGTSHVIEVARHLRLVGVDVYVFCRGRGRDPEWIVHEGTRIRRFFAYPLVRRGGAKKGLASLPQRARVWAYRGVDSILDAFRLACWCSGHNIDVIYERVSHASVAGALAARVLRVPFVAEVNDLNFHPLTLRLASAIVVPAPMSLGRSVQRKCYAVPWGADTKKITPLPKPLELQARLGVEGRPTVVFVSSFLPWHGARFIVEAASLVIQQFPQVRFVMIGKGPEQSSTIEEACRLGLREYFVFTGFVDHSVIGDYLAVADVTVAPYTGLLGAQKGRAQMACSLKVLEYMAAGKPVVVTAVGNRGEIVADGVTGLEIPDTDPASLAGALCTLLGDSGLAMRMGARGRELVERKSSWRGHVESLRHIFESVAGT